MTNEQLCVMIKQGGADDLLPVLWARVKHLCFLICGRYFQKYSDRFAACGVELSDLRQECYPAFLLAVNSFRNEDDLKFSSFLEYPVRNAAAELLGIHNADRVNRKPLDNATSLDKPIDTADGDAGTLGDIIPDRQSAEPFEQVLQQVADDHTRAVLMEALAKLTEQERDVIIMIFFEGRTAQAIAEDWRVSTQRIGQIKAKAIRLLRGMPALKMLDEEYQLERRLHFDSRANGYKYMIAQQQVKRILLSGEYLTFEQRQKLEEGCKLEEALDNDPVYNALCALEQGGRRRSDFLLYDEEQEIRQRADEKLKELSAYREITYGLRQAVIYDERQKYLAERAVRRVIGRNENNDRKAT